MAENEYLDSRKARRWASVAGAIRNRLPIDEIGRLVLEQFQKTMRNIAKDMPLPEWISASKDPNELAKSFDGISGAFDVKDALFQAAVKGRETIQIQGLSVE
jgi:ABC-type oligopeptide transport system substrate-binding subunit